MNPSFEGFLILGMILFVIGLMVLLTRRSLLTLLAALLIMFHGSIVAVMAAIRFYGDALGPIISVVLIAIVMAQFLIGLGVVRLMLRDQGSVDVTKYRYLKE